MQNIKTLCFTCGLVKDYLKTRIKFFAIKNLREYLAWDKEDGRGEVVVNKWLGKA